MRSGSGSPRAMQVLKTKMTSAGLQLQVRIAAESTGRGAPATARSSNAPRSPLAAHDTCFADDRRVRHPAAHIIIVIYFFLKRRLMVGSYGRRRSTPTSHFYSRRISSATNWSSRRIFCRSICVRSVSRSAIPSSACCSVFQPPISWRRDLRSSATGGFCSHHPILVEPVGANLGHHVHHP